ncbi:prealbumin-like fold domain-containing protein, partial [Eubacterium maltosivorans]
HVCGNTAVIEDNQGNIDENNAPGILTDQDGRAAFTNLALDQEYRITEISTQEGYNLLAEPVLVKLAYETASGQIGNGKSLFYTKDGKNYYKDIIITIENNQTLVMPETAGNGFFWPGMAGMTVIFGTVGAILVKKERERRKLQP